MVLAALELPLLMRGKRLSQAVGNGRAKFAAGLQSE
jgi:hypothetical protein